MVGNSLVSLLVSKGEKGGSGVFWADL